MAIEST